MGGYCIQLPLAAHSLKFSFVVSLLHSFVTQQNLVLRVAWNPKSFLFSISVINIFFFLAKVHWSIYALHCRAGTIFFRGMLPITHSPSLILNLCNLSACCCFPYRHAQAFPILETFSCSHLPLELTISLPRPHPVYLSKLLKRTLHWLFQLPGFPLATLAAS